MNSSPLHMAYPTILLNQKPHYQLNNKYNDFPPLMNDGRSLTTTWQSDTVTNEHLQQSANIKSNWEYRRYLTQNAKQLQTDLLSQSLNDVGYTVRNETPHLNQTFQSPIIYKSFHNPIRHRFSEDSDLKNTYLSREQLQEKRVVPSVSQEQLFRTHLQ